MQSSVEKTVEKTEEKTGKNATKKDTKKSTKKALLIGINYFGTSSELSGCHNDVDNVAEVLKKTFGFLETNITVLKDNIADPNNLKSRAPTRKNIIAWINKIRSSLKNGDKFFIHYSGHGYYVEDSKFDKDTEADGYDEVICPADGTMIKDDELHYLLVDMLPMGVKLRALFDCCHSGTVLDLSYSWKQDNDYNFETKCTTCDRLTPKDVLMISGGMDSQTSAEAYITGKYAGAMTWAFLESVRESFGTQKSSKITWKDLINNMRFKLLTSEYEQIPQLCCSDKKLINEPLSF